MEVHEAHPRERGRIEDPRGEERRRVRGQQLQRGRVRAHPVQLLALLRDCRPDLRGDARLRRYALGPLPSREPRGDRPGSEPLDQREPEPHQSPRPLRRAPLQRPHPRASEHPLLELPRAERADGRFCAPGRRRSQRPGTQSRRQRHRQGVQQHRSAAHRRRPRRRRAATRSARFRSRAGSSRRPRQPRSTAPP